MKTGVWEKAKSPSRPPERVTILSTQRVELKFLSDIERKRLANQRQDRTETIDGREYFVSTPAFVALYEDALKRANPRTYKTVSKRSDGKISYSYHSEEKR